LSIVWPYLKVASFTFLRQAVAQTRLGKVKTTDGFLGTFPLQESNARICVRAVIKPAKKILGAAIAQP